MASGKQKALKKIRVVCIQTNAGTDYEKNLQTVYLQVRRALQLHPHIIALPEMFFWRGPSSVLSRVARKIAPQVIREFKALAKANQTAFLLGSLPEPGPARSKFYNTSLLLSETGKIAARYRKIHLFDSHLEKARVRESRHIIRGSKIVSGKVFGRRMGLTICYDLRFPELFRRLSARGSVIVFVPSNFTFETGKAHWEVLLRARAIENQVFIAAPAQTGRHPVTGLRSYGNSLMVDPWGRVLARASLDRTDILMADFDLARQYKLRKVFPVLRHRVLTP